MKEINMLFFKKLTTVVTITVLSSVLLSGCSAAPQTNDNQPMSSTLTEQTLAEEMVNTVCLLKNRSVITSEDITAFRNLAKKMDSYDGENSDKVREASMQVQGVANTYETAVGKDLGIEAANKHTEACDSLKEKYDSEYN